jgi:hypothetical protein
MLSLILKLNIPCMVVNRVNEDDNNFNKNFKKLFQTKVIDPALSIHAGLLKISCNSDIGMMHLYFKDQIITSDIGFNTSFAIGDKWLDSTKAKWEAISGNNWISIKILFPGVPITQDWLIRLRKKSLFWKVTTYFNDDVDISQRKTGFIFSDRYYKYMINGLSFIFPLAETEWKDVGLFKAAQVQLTPAAGLPVISFIRREFKKENNFIQLQLMPSTFCASMVNFCTQKPALARAPDKKVKGFKHKIIEKQRINLLI